MLSGRSSVEHFHCSVLQCQYKYIFKTTSLEQRWNKSTCQLILTTWFQCVKKLLWIWIVKSKLLKKSGAGGGGRDGGGGGGGGVAIWGKSSHLHTPSWPTWLGTKTSLSWQGPWWRVHGYCWMNYSRITKNMLKAKYDVYFKESEHAINLGRVIFVEYTCELAG